jgi:hypothetical protein
MLRDGGAILAGERRIDTGDAPAMHAIRALAALSAAAWLAAGCSWSGEDVRVRLCKDIVALRSGAPPVFDGADIRIRGYEHAEVRLYYSANGESGSASCFYAHDAVEDTADQIANPINAYATSPYRVIIGMETLPRDQLATAIGRAMQKQGREFVEESGEAARKVLAQ